MCDRTLYSGGEFLVSKKRYNEYKRATINTTEVNEHQQVSMDINKLQVI
jgi:hypothetical protein